MPTRRQALALASGAAAAALGVGHATAQPAPATRPAAPRRRPPNIVFLFADQLRTHDVGAYGFDTVGTPHIDRIAQDGARFNHALSTHPVCSVYRSMLLTGLQPCRNGMLVNDHWLRPELLRDGAPVLGHELRGAGLSTMYIGKWHVDGHGREAYIPPGRRLGFERFLALECTHSYNASSYYADNDPVKRQWPGYDAIPQARAAQEFIREKARADERFALFLSWGPPHDPYIAPPDYEALFDPATIELRANCADTRFAEQLRASEPWNFPASMQNLRDIVRPRLSTEANVRKSTAGYRAATRLLDDLVGDIRRTLEEEGILGDTLLVFTSDHGDMLGSHGLSGKQMPHEESISVPLVAMWPGEIPAGTESDELFGPCDWLPTMLGLAGREPSAPMDGVDLSRAMRGDAGPGRDALLIARMTHLSNSWLADASPTWRGVRTPTHTYARDNWSGKPWLLFDNVADPLQMHNLVATPGHEGLVQALEQRTVELLKAANDSADDLAIARQIVEENPRNGGVKAFLDANT